jgi:hypothetical protein
MDPFSIVIRRNSKPLTLNIHPKDSTGFMVLFEGALVGELFLDEQGRTWGALSARELFKDGHKGQRCDVSVDCEGLMFDKELMNRIGREILTELNLND